jgi:phage-related tail protein
MSRPDQAAGRLLHSTVDVFLDRTRAVADLVAGAGGSAVDRLPEPVPAAVNRMLSSLRQLAEQAPPLTAELDVLIQEVHAKRKSIQALQAELAALDKQLEVFERTLAPLETWTRQWSRIQHALTETLEPVSRR